MYNVIFSGTMLTDADLSGAAFSSLERNAPHFAGARLPKALDALGVEMRAMLIAPDAWIRSAERQGQRAGPSSRDASGPSFSSGERRVGKECVGQCRFWWWVDT